MALTQEDTPDQDLNETDIEGDELDVDGDDVVDFEDSDDVDADDDGEIAGSVSGDEAASADDAKVAHRAGMDRARVRRIAAKAVEVVLADAKVTAAAAAILGCNDDAVTLTTAIFAADRGALADLETLEKSMVANPFALGGMLMQLNDNDRQGLRALWQLAKQFGAKLPEKVPSNAMQVVEIFGEALQAMPQSTVTDIAAVRALARKA